VPTGSGKETVPLEGFVAFLRYDWLGTRALLVLLSERVVPAPLPCAACFLSRVVGVASLYRQCSIVSCAPSRALYGIAKLLQHDEYLEISRREMV
jgi:hypothetical protein